MEKIDDIKYILLQLLNLSLQDIGEVVAIDKTTLSCSLDNKIQKCPYCRSSHLHSKGDYKKSIVYLLIIVTSRSFCLRLNVLSVKNVTILSRIVSGLRLEISLFRIQQSRVLWKI